MQLGTSLFETKARSLRQLLSPSGMGQHSTPVAAFIALQRSSDGLNASYSSRALLFVAGSFASRLARAKNEEASAIFRQSADLWLPYRTQGSTHPKTKLISEGCQLGLQFAPLQVVPS